ncbi:methyl viologen-reducing hydrogenase [Desulforhabdus amnigena]|uniref:F420-nonreducing hydrogenase n=1 Tax=Desulforhabdus amnigena TaxID=40218 RepID=A0A9W6FTZ3_9BACT|nr:methyl viologen-reducing hydrogenase [Desulforhabdus amnigena]NLJ28245.1 methyl viologen-reducing hydrogenase [Deltaproteobacteria bacterium]GLI34835.1 F420-nonreducing hydrogenase [Desulforhabdus amnigena]
MPLTVALECLNSCSGCEMAILNMGTAFLDLLPELNVVHMPLLMDHKYYGEKGGGAALTIPEADVGLVSGGVRNREHMNVAEEMRKKCRIIVALGTCATHGGIPALINSFSNEELLLRYFGPWEKDGPPPSPHENVPPLLDRTYALDEKIKIDIYLPGCPPHPDSIRNAIQALLLGERPTANAKSVCDSCPALREGKSIVKETRRFTESAEYSAAEPLSRMRCLLEQGFICMGPVTRGGCAGSSGGAPRCIIARVPCRGCFGPIKQNGNQLLDLMNALAGRGVDIRGIPDRTSILRFSGAHRRLVRLSRKSTALK